jgi:hypothetical protein
VKVPLTPVSDPFSPILLSSFVEDFDRIEVIADRHDERSVPFQVLPRFVHHAVVDDLPMGV